MTSCWGKKTKKKKSHKHLYSKHNIVIRFIDPTELFVILGCRAGRQNVLFTATFFFSVLVFFAPKVKREKKKKKLPLSVQRIHSYTTLTQLGKKEKKIKPKQKDTQKERFKKKRRFRIHTCVAFARKVKLFPSLCNFFLKELARKHFFNLVHRERRGAADSTEILQIHSSRLEQKRETP